MISKIRSILISLRLQSQVMLLFNRSSRSMLPRFSRSSIVFDNDESNHTSPINKQPQIRKYVDTCKDFFPPAGSNVQYSEKTGLWINGTVVRH